MLCPMAATTKQQKLISDIDPVLAVERSIERLRVTRKAILQGRKAEASYMLGQVSDACAQAQAAL